MKKLGLKSRIMVTVVIVLAVIDSLSRSHCGLIKRTALLPLGLVLGLVTALFTHHGYAYYSDAIAVEVWK